MYTDVRTLLRDPYLFDFVEFESRQRALIAKVRASAYFNEDVESMLALVETRLDEYHHRVDAEAP
ncbi:MAG: hypothetical protein JRI25_09190 [Deltaproteobacteria bacterium]|nr:hypothetical protein [Deltaproteobacteria bacterium]